MAFAVPRRGYRDAGSCRLIVWVAYGVWDNWRIVARAWPIVPLRLRPGMAGEWLGLTELRSWRGTPVRYRSRDAGDRSGRSTGRTSQLVGPHRRGRTRGKCGRGLVDIWHPTPWGRCFAGSCAISRPPASARSIPADAAPLILTPVEDQPRLGSYSGAEFAVLQRWTSPTCPILYRHLRWVLYREARTPPKKRA